MDSFTSGSSRASGGAAPTSLLVGSLAAGAGALAWSAISYFTLHEVGYVAWAVGALVGLAVARSGGRGIAYASAAAVLTVAGIAGGKLLGTRLVVDKEFRETCEATYTRELHRELVDDAAAFAELDEDVGDEELRRFMVEHYFTGADSPEDVQAEELKTFRATNVADLRALHARQTSYEDWKRESTAESRRSFEQEFSIVQANLDGLNGIDVLFLVLGTSTAFGIVRRASGAASSDEPASDEQDTRKAA